MSTHITSNERISLLRKEKGLSQQALANLIGVSRSYLGDIEAGRSEPSANFLTQISSKMNVSTDWLLTGEGTMLKGGGANDELSEEKREWLRMLDLLDDDAKKATFATTKTLAKSCQMAREFAQFRQEISQQAMAA